ncbi:ethanolamine ammonia-lyase subunit EutC [Nakamurella leprariae]|uniref:Ethanolamine ammonia-lyase small subunit n=1 Tax=Nakamurella leprariae TaxID=2803911 RepID=A0A939BV28_9ACTN|nr:ethanolamine ammonia-lyase subunit EutC [Nakamurella leprariae]MBM9466118.1 ethanolamine ammonia-lyase subunit EutC [Nakamurella leprariae]
MNPDRPDDGALPAVSDFWSALSRTTRARIGLGRSGDALPTRRVLELRTDHAAARDAVHTVLDVPRLQADLQTDSGGGAAPVVHSAAGSRGEYLRRPDLGRRLAPDTVLPRQDADLAVVLADGLSPTALQRHGAPLLGALRRAAAGRLRLATPVIALQARVALGDRVAELLGTPAVVVLIGERPGLTTSDSLGAYLTHAPGLGTTDADRNCVSNIHPPEGLEYAVAAETVVRLALCARQLGRSGVDLKADVGLDALPGNGPSVLDAPLGRD